jgi:hypothetical protein
MNPNHEESEWKAQEEDWLEEGSNHSLVRLGAVLPAMAHSAGVPVLVGGAPTSLKDQTDSWEEPYQ